MIFLYIRAMESEALHIKDKLESIRGYGQYVHDELVVVSSPQYDPLFNPLPDVTGYETYEDVHDVDKTLDKNLSATRFAIIDNNLKMLEAALVLIEAQMALRNKLDEPDNKDIQNCIAEDKTAFIRLMEETICRPANSPQLQDGSEHASFVYKLGLITEDFADVACDRVPKKLSSMDAPALQDKIFDLRCHFAELALDKAHFRYAEIHTDMEYIKYMKRFIDDATIEDLPFMQEEMRDRFKRSADALPVYDDVLTNIDKFATALSQIENEAIPAGGVKPYKALTIVNIRFFNP